MSDLTIPIALVPYSEAYQGLILSTWAKQIRKFTPFKHMDADEFRDHMALVCATVERCPPMMVVHGDHQEQVFGWCCGENVSGKYILHMVYVRNVWRQRGIGAKIMRYHFPLLGKKTIYYTHPASSTPHHIDRWKLKPNPYLLVVNPWLHQK